VDGLRKDFMTKHRNLFKQAPKEAIRGGPSRANRPQTRRFAQKTFPLGAEQIFPWDSALAVAGAMEDEELGRKLSLRK